MVGAGTEESPRALLPRVAIGFLVATVLSAGACARKGPGVTKDDHEMIGDIAAPLQAARATRLFFSHHSVGRNLLAGVQSLATQAGGKLEVAELTAAAAQAGPAWLHGSGGRNGDPKSKVDYFLATVTDPQFKADLAFMKFCYVDFNPRTNVDEVLAHYRQAMDRLKRARPDVKLAHVTAPLVVRPTSIKWRIYRLLGREVWEDAANVKRQEFNQKLAAAFPSDPIFDLARAESTRRDGSRESFDVNGRTTPSLVPDYSDDGGHLNALGERVVGAEMIRFVASAVRPGVAQSANN